ncbi:MAG: hypothetical protein U0Y82_06415 [Thermoleophilia bacterium]
METIIQIASDSATYADRFVATVKEHFDVDVNDPGEFDVVGLLPAFVLSGASVATDAHGHGDHVHVVGITVQVPGEMLDAFYATLPNVLSAHEDDDEPEDDEED